MMDIKKMFLFAAVLSLFVPASFLFGIGPYLHSLRCYIKRDFSLWSKNYISHIERRHQELQGKATTKDRLSRTETKGSLAVVPPQERGCSYTVQVYDENDKLIRTSPVLQDVVKQFRPGSPTQTDIRCENHRCDISLTIADDKNRFAGMDAVVFHFAKRLIPRPRPSVSMNPNQTWVYFTWESPRSTGQEPGVRRLPVHATWTYHRASEITLPYGFYRPGVPMTKEVKSVDEWLKGKTKLIAWMASNCISTFWPRSKFVKELKNYLPVDTYGACGNLTCKPVYSTKCTVDLMHQYKFYLSLENAECDDYITEKLWHKPLMQGVVPIVYGPRRKIYEELLPPNSFIYIGDFKSMKELADYLRLLDSRPDLYVQYLQWQYKGSVGTPKQMHQSYDPSIFCSLIPVIERVKTGKLKRVQVGKTAAFKSCRKPTSDEDQSKYSFGLGKWYPW